MEKLCQRCAHSKKTAVAVFGEAQFELHKWHSNAPELEVSSAPDDCNQSYAKEQLGVKPGETKMLGLPWDKTEDMIAVTFPEPPPIYDPLGVVSPVSLVGKLLYREVCDQNQSWDKKVPEHIERKVETIRQEPTRPSFSSTPCDGFPGSD